MLSFNAHILLGQSPLICSSCKILVIDLVAACRCVAPRAQVSTYFRLTIYVVIVVCFVFFFRAQALGFLDRTHAEAFAQGALGIPTP